MHNLQQFVVSSDNLQRNGPPLQSQPRWTGYVWEEKQTTEAALQY